MFLFSFIVFKHVNWKVLPDWNTLTISFFNNSEATTCLPRCRVERAHWQLFTKVIFYCTSCRWLQQFRWDGDVFHYLTVFGSPRIRLLQPLVISSNAPILSGPLSALLPRRRSEPPFLRRRGHLVVTQFEPRSAAPPTLPACLLLTVSTDLLNYRTFYLFIWALLGLVRPFAVFASHFFPLQNHHPTPDEWRCSYWVITSHWGILKLSFWNHFIEG